MIIFHGSFCELAKPEIRQSRHSKDFGQGFYCTELRMQAERWAKRFDSPVVNVFEYIEQCGLNTLRFSEMTEEWLDFIVDCRTGKLHPYDVVIGAMANDQVWNYIADYIAGVLTREQFWVLAQFKHPTHQIALCSSAALETLKFVNSYEVK